MRNLKPQSNGLVLHLNCGEARLLVRAAITGLRGSHPVRQDSRTAISLLKKIGDISGVLVGER